MIRTILVLLCITLPLAGAAPLAWGHGFELSVSGNTLVGTSDDFPGNGNINLFNIGLTAGGDDWFRDQGGPGASGFGTGKTLGFDVYGSLWYSNGGPAQLADPDISLLIEGIGTITVDRDSTFTPGFAILGNSTHELLFTVQGDGIPVPAGVYGIGYRVTGSPNGGQPYIPTELLVPTWTTGSFSGDNAAAQAALIAAVVPEPSSVVLLGFAMLAAAYAGMRTRRRRMLQR